MAKARPPRISYSGLVVLKAFLSAPELGPLAGADIMRVCGIPSGTMYPMLGRFEASGILAGAWERQKPSELGRPRRRLYRLTKAGAAFAQAALAKVAL